MALIEVENIKKIYRTDDVTTPALRGISFRIEKGEFVAIMGPSGSGKSTLLHVLGFLDRPTGGTYRFSGKAMNEYSEEELAKVRNQKMGFVFQAFNLLARSSVFENVRLPLLYSGIPEPEWKQRAEQAIEMVGLSHRSTYETSRLSGGEKQRVAVARALVQDPEVIFADEPTGNLDSVSGRTIMEYFKQLNEAGRTVVLITHETYTARYAERILHLKDGALEGEERIDQDKRVSEFLK